MERIKAMTTILIIDDSPTDSYVARRCAEEFFAKVLCVQDVAGAFEALREHEPDVVLMDLTLNDAKNGITLISEIRSTAGHQQAVPILVCSARATPADETIAFNAGANGYIVKPLSSQSLSDAMTLLSLNVAKPRA